MEDIYTVSVTNDITSQHLYVNHRHYILTMNITIVQIQIKQYISLTQHNGTIISPEYMERHISVPCILITMLKILILIKYMQIVIDDND